MNRVILTGRLGKAPEVRTLSTGRVVANFRLAVPRRFKDKEGNRATDWLSIVVWGSQAERCQQYLDKGSKVGVVGSIQTRSYQKSDGTTAYVTEIVAEDIEYMDDVQKKEQSPEGFYEIAEGMPF